MIPDREKERILTQQYKPPDLKTDPVVFYAFYSFLSKDLTASSAQSLPSVMTAIASLNSLAHLSDNPTSFELRVFSSFVMSRSWLFLSFKELLYLAYHERGLGKCPVVGSLGIIYRECSGKNLVIGYFYDPLVLIAF